MPTYFTMRYIAYSLYIALFLGLIVKQTGCNTPKTASTTANPTNSTTKTVAVKDSVPKPPITKVIDSSFWAHLVPIKPVPHAAGTSAITGAIQVGAERSYEYMPFLEGKKVACVVNQTSMISGEHLVDVLLAQKINVVEIFSPEHGFRGTAEAGDEVTSGIDSKTGVPIVSLYGKKHRPSAEELSKVDVVIFDVQDVGARFYTYLTTLYYVMEECARYNKQLIVLDRPNPNGHYVDGPLLKPAQKSFVGALPIPIVHGCTLGEMARMINGEGWLDSGNRCDLKIIPCSNYTHQTAYILPIKPSPNLPNNKAIYLYPSLCLFEGTCVSVGRGTEYPFQCFGHPDCANEQYAFMPMPNERNKNPLLNGRTCNGSFLGGLSDEELYTKHNKLDISFVVECYQKFRNKPAFFRTDGFFNNLAGNSEIKNEIIAGKSAEEIRASWQDELATYKEKRRKYLLYPDFE